MAQDILIKCSLNRLHLLIMRFVILRKLEPIVLTGEQEPGGRYSNVSNGTVWK